MKICFYHQAFDVDVSSGTDHARHQWHELASAFGVSEMAVINETYDDFKPVNASIKVHEYSNLSRFLEKKKCIFIEHGDYRNHRSFRIPEDHWIVFGGAHGLPRNLTGTYITISTQTALYPRQAAAIILENQWALSHS